MKEMPTYFIFILFFTVLSSCSKSNSPPTTPVADPNPPQHFGRCGDTTSVALLKTIEKSETKKSEVEAEAKKSPAKANFRKLFDAEVAFGKEIEETITRLSRCEDPVPETVLEELKKKAAASQSHANYLVESFPDFKLDGK